ncbi:hypothetical protein ACFQ48_21110 [Hymenobacter caeli]|uniref:Uncharacterized protein n=1 Tax=Hymenobacter caeli TaxID=2735894 RepID=A0ABX2FW57_9BACT|nr:hypothetical protein [Hymenobacter caeli]NRT21460.1 hypothetical protein [Hymenobacter caeli]
MKPVSNLLELFESSAFLPLIVKEDFERLEVEGPIAANNLVIPLASILEKRAFELLRISGFRLSIICDGNDSIDLDSNALDYVDFLSSIQREIDLHFVTCIIKLICYKDSTGSSIPVFNLAEIVKYLNSLNYKQLLLLLWHKFKTNNYLAFELVEDFASDFGTGSIFFLKDRKYPTPEETVALQLLRVDRFNSIRNVSHFENAAECQFIPDDFGIINELNCPDSVRVLLNCLCGLFSIISLFDITRLVDEGIEFKLNGYKSISGILSGSRMHMASIIEYYKIYNWVYYGGNLSDKIGLTRNLVSIHLISPENLELRGNPYDSVRSAFDLYLKQNIKQYIELRSKISDQLIDQTNKATKIAEEFAGGYKKSILAVVSFFASVIVAKVFSTKELHGIFTKEASIISFAFLVISAAYFLLSYVEFSKEKIRFVKNYQNLQSRFTDLLVKEDIDRILDQDKIHKDDVAYMDSKIFRFSLMWSSTLVIMLLAVLLLSDTYNFYNIGQWFSSLIPSSVK